MQQAHLPKRARWRDVLHEIIFEADPILGRLFDLGLLVTIVVSMVVVMLESVASVRSEYGWWLRLAEWLLTIAFTIEYVLRMITVERPLRYAASFFGVVDLLSILPTYVSLLIPGAQSLIVIRTLRLLRVFRVLKLVHFLTEASQLQIALRQSLRKIIVFIGTVVTVVIIMGAIMYLIEGEEHGFSSIPRSVYWAIVTMTTVGYGDIAPQTVLGQFVASTLMILGYGVIAVPTGIVSVELAQARGVIVSTRACKVCATEGHDIDAHFCKNCGAELDPV